MRRSGVRAIGVVDRAKETGVRRSGSGGNGSRNGSGGNGSGGNGSGGRGPRPRLVGSIDYTLAKRALLREFRVGLLSRFDICDAHPELMRAAKYVGEPATRACPVCDKQDLRLLAYVYADDLKADNGRVWQLREAIALAAQHRGGCCYVVEVCTRCSWNHLSQTYTARYAG